MEAAKYIGNYRYVYDPWKQRYVDRPLLSKSQKHKYFLTFPSAYIRGQHWSDISLRTGAIWQFGGRFLSADTTQLSASSDSIAPDMIYDPFQSIETLFFRFLKFIVVFGAMRKQ